MGAQEPVVQALSYTPPAYLRVSAANAMSSTAPAATKSSSPEAPQAMHAEFWRKSRNQRQIIAAAFFITLFTLVVMGGTILFIENANKETHVGSDGVMTVAGTSTPVRVSLVESHASLMSIPSLSAEKLADIISMNVKVDMTTMPSMGAVMEATFQVSGAYKAIGATDKAFLMTPSGYTVTINSADRTGTIAMGSMGTFPLVVSDKERRLFATGMNGGDEDLGED